MFEIIRGEEEIQEITRTVLGEGNRDAVDVSLRKRGIPGTGRGWGLGRLTQLFEKENPLLNSEVPSSFDLEKTEEEVSLSDTSSQTQDRISSI